MTDYIVNSYKQLIVWQKAMDLVVKIYSFTDRFPDSEKFGLISQMRRCAVSIPSNIAEGRRRGSKKDYKHFLNIAYGSGAELETQIEIVTRLKLGKESELSEISRLLDEIMRILNKMLTTMTI